MKMCSWSRAACWHRERLVKRLESKSYSEWDLPHLGFRTSGAGCSRLEMHTPCNIKWVAYLGHGCCGSQIVKALCPLNFVNFSQWCVTLQCGIQNAVAIHLLVLMPLLQALRSYFPSIKWGISRSSIGLYLASTWKGCLDNQLKAHEDLPLAPCG